MASHGEESSVSRVSKASTRLHRSRLEPLVLHLLSPTNGESKKEFPIDAATPHRGYKKHFFLSLAVVVVAIIVSALMWQVSTPCVTFRQNNPTSTIVSYSSFCLRDNSSVMGNSIWILQWGNKTNAGDRWLMNITWDVVKLMPRFTTMIGAKVYAWACDGPILALKWFFFEARAIAQWVWWVIEMSCHYIYFFCIHVNSAVAEGYHGNPSSEPNKTLIEWIGAVLEYFFRESSTSTLQTAAESSMFQMESPYQSLSVKSKFEEECAAGQPWNSAGDAQSHEQSEMCSQPDKSEEEDSVGKEEEEEEGGGQVFLRVWRWLITAERPRGRTKNQEPQPSSVSDTSGDYASSLDANDVEDDGSKYWFALLRDGVTGGLPPTTVSEFTSGGLQEKDVQEGSRVSTDKTAGDVVTIPNELDRTEKDSVSLVTEPIVTHHRVGTTGSAAADDDADAGGVTKPNDAGHTIAKDVIEPLNLTSSSSAVVEKADPQCEGLVCVGHLDLGSADSATEGMDEKFNSSVLPKRMAVWSNAKKEKSKTAAAAAGRGGGGGGDFISSLPIPQENAGLCEVTMHDCARDLDEHEKGCQHRIADAVNLESQRTQKVFDASMAEKMRQFQSKCELVTAVAVREERERVQQQCRKHESEALELERQRIQNMSRPTSSTNAYVQEQSQLSTSDTFEKEREILMSQCNESTTKSLEVQAQELQKACEKSTRIMFENEKEDWMKQCHLATARAVEESVYALRLQNDQTAVEERVQLQEECQQTTSASVEKMKKETEERCKAQILSVVHETTQGLVQECHENTTRAIAREVQTLLEENVRARTKFIEEERQLLEAQCEQRTREAVHLQSEKLRVEFNESMTRMLHDLQKQQQRKVEEEREGLLATCGDMGTAAAVAGDHRLDVRGRPATGEDIFPQRAENELLCSGALESLQIKADADCVAQLNEARKENHAECNVEATCEELRGIFNQGILMRVALFTSTALCVVFGVYALLLRKQLRNITATAISPNASCAKGPTAKSSNVKSIDKGASSDDDTVTGIPENSTWHCNTGTDSIPWTAADSAIVSCYSPSRNTEFLAALMTILRRIYVAYLNSREVHYVELLDSIIMHEATVAQMRLLETRHHEQLHNAETAASMFVEGEQLSMMIGCAIITECRYRSELVAHEAHRRAALQCRAVAALTAEITRLAACSERPRGEHYEKSTQTGHIVNDNNSDHSEVGKEGLAEVMRDMLLAENRARHMLQLQLKLMRCRDVPSLCSPLPVAQPRSSRPFLSPLYERDEPVMGSAGLSPEMPGSASQGRAVEEASMYSGRNEAHR